jgi:hypothetical protein
MIGLIHKVKVWQWSPEIANFSAEVAAQYADQAKTISCNAQPASSESLMRRFGVEIQRGWKFFIRGCDASFVRHGDMVQLGTKIMKVSVPPEIHEQRLHVDYAVFVAEEVRP